MTQSVDQTMLVELMTAGLQPELIARVANACAAAYARGLIDGTPHKSSAAIKQRAYRGRLKERNGVTESASNAVTESVTDGSRWRSGRRPPPQGGGGSNQCKDHTS